MRLERNGSETERRGDDELYEWKQVTDCREKQERQDDDERRENQRDGTWHLSPFWLSSVKQGMEEETKAEEEEEVSADMRAAFNKQSGSIFVLENARLVNDWWATEQ